MANYKDVEKLVSKDKLTDAIELLRSKNISSDLSVIEGNLSNLQRQVMLNLIGIEQANIERSRIRFSILNLIKKENNLQKHSAIYRNKYYLLIFLIIVVATGSIIAFYPKTKPEPVELIEPLASFQNNGKYNILLSSFRPYSEVKVANFEGAIFDRIESLGIEYTLPIEIIINKDINTEEKPLSYQKAEIIGQATKANLLIWGNYEVPPSSDSTLINVKYLTTDKLGETIYTTQKGETGAKSIYTLSSLAQGQLTGNVEDIVLWALGIRACIEGEYKIARNFFKKITKQNKIKNSLLNQAIAETYIYGKQYDKALEALDKAIFETPNSLIALNNRATIYAELRKYELAIKDIEKANTISSNDSILNKNQEIIRAELKLQQILISKKNHRVQNSSNLKNKEKSSKVSLKKIKSNKEEEEEEEDDDDDDDNIGFVDKKTKKQKTNFTTSLSSRIEKTDCSKYIKISQIQSGQKVVWTEPQTLTIASSLSCNIRFVKSKLGIVAVFSTQNPTLSKKTSLLFKTNAGQLKEFKSFIDINMKTELLEKTFTLNNEDLIWFMNNDVTTLFIKNNEKMTMKKYSISNSRMKNFQDYAACFLNSIQ
jgi:tetratricopeptide (TPR) repeat protein